MKHQASAGGLLRKIGQLRNNMLGQNKPVDRQHSKEFGMASDSADLGLN